MKLSDAAIIFGFVTTAFTVGVGYAKFNDRMEKLEATVTQMKKAPPPALTYREQACIDILKNLNAASRGDNSLAAIHLEGLADKYGCDTGARPATADPDSKHVSSVAPN